MREREKERENLKRRKYRGKRWGRERERARKLREKNWKEGEIERESGRK